MLLDEEPRAEVAAALLVAQHGEDDVAGQLHPLRVRAQERGQEHRDAALHVERAATPHPAVLEHAVERRVRPFLPGRGDDVDVAVQQERIGVAAGKARDEVRPAGNLLVALRLDSCAAQERLDVRDARFLVTGRIRRVETDQLAQELDRIGNGHSSASAVSSPSTSASVL